MIEGPWHSRIAADAYGAVMVELWKSTSREKVFYPIWETHMGIQHLIRRVDRLAYRKNKKWMKRNHLFAELTNG